jgi:hypothetical protein
MLDVDQVFSASYNMSSKNNKRSLPKEEAKEIRQVLHKYRLLMGCRSASPQ